MFRVRSGVKSAVLVFAALLSASAVDLTGTWIIWPAGSGPAGYHNDQGFDWIASGGRLSGSAYLREGSGPIAGGAIAGDRFSFSVPSRYDGSPMAVEGTVSGNTMRFTSAGVAMEGRRLESQVASPVSVDASDSDATGKWHTWFVGPFGLRPKMFAGVDLDLQLSHGRLTGSAHMGNWPGDAPISDAYYAAGHFTFTVTGRLPSSSGYPKVQFGGTIHGKEMKLNLLWGRSIDPLDGRKVEL